jgi:endonuclease YncB( thermonuclease family)
VRLEDLDVTLRLSAIDCPESGQSWGDKATIGLVRMIGGKMVLVEKHGVDPYGRTIATIYLKEPDGLKNINERMVMLGHAWVMRRYYKHLPIERQQQLNRLEHWAKKKKMGLWNQDNPMPPWKWRQKQAVV